jgi:hypothetical protein
MYSYSHFKPGGNRNTARLIYYVSVFNALNPTKEITCYSVLNKYDKNTPGSDALSARVSNATRTSQLVNNQKGGTTQFGNFYLGQPLNLNYLGKTEGMPGGSGSPPVNRFN